MTQITTFRDPAAVQITTFRKRVGENGLNKPVHVPHHWRQRSRDLDIHITESVYGGPVVIWASLVCRLRRLFDVGVPRGSESEGLTFSEVEPA